MWPVTRALLLAMLILLPGWALIVKALADESERVEASRSAVEMVLAAPPGPMVPADAYARAQFLFSSTCATCHGPTGTGVPHLGKDLLHSNFIASRSDAELGKFLVTGRPITDPRNTTGIPMPPKGGRADLPDERMHDVAAYLRALQDPRRRPTVSADLLAAAAKELTPPPPAALAGADPAEAEWIAEGQKFFIATCSACHGADGKGIQGNGKNLATSEFLKAQDDEKLAAFIKRGRDASDPLNTTKVIMPPKGGNPALNDDQIDSIIMYLRALQRSAGTTK